MKIGRQHILKDPDGQYWVVEGTDGEEALISRIGYDESKRIDTDVDGWESLGYQV